MSKSKQTRPIITLECTECRKMPIKKFIGISRYITTKNRKNTPERIELQKYCAYCYTHTIHKEIK